MSKSDILILGSNDVHALLRDKEPHISAIVARAYQAHGNGHSSLPHSTFLRFPNSPADRIIALPAYLGDGVNSAGIKWIASFPLNVERGFDRASAVLILNSVETGRPKAVIEGSIISANRTAASAALAAQVLRNGTTGAVGIVGCGLINFETMRFLTKLIPEARTFLVHDLDPERARLFKNRCESSFPKIEVRLAADINSVLANASLISFATTAGQPHVMSLQACAPGTVILHTSLRDLAPDVILASDNVVDDIDHVCRAQTSIHLTEQKVGNRSFIRCTLADILDGRAPARVDDKGVAVFSPFGLGILDIAVAEYAYTTALAEKKGKVITSFLPDDWNRNATAISA